MYENHILTQKHCITSAIAVCRLLESSCYWRRFLISTVYLICYLSKQLTRLMWTVVMFLLILLKNENCKAIVLLCAMITLFTIGKGRVMKFVTQKRYKDALCRRFAKIRGDIDESFVPQSVRDWYEGMDDEQDTDSENESDCEWS